MDYLIPLPDSLPNENFLPIQAETTRERTPEERLVFSILIDAVWCYQKYKDLPGVRAKRLFEETENWFKKNDRAWPFSFVNICAVLGYDPDYLRRGLREGKGEKVTHFKMNVSLYNYANTKWTDPEMPRGKKGFRYGSQKAA